ncbi:hemerythrin domain-containing protein [Brevibacillus fluminis]|uniref:hemerythrin domain-containing protein n=1 Tax=Brevibacillus fluminis TaxID=511487 RepID=UPI003F8B43F1
MEQHRTGCMGMLHEFGRKRNLCPPLQSLLVEHRSLGEKMSQLAHLAKELKRSPAPVSGQMLKELYELGSAFRTELDQHSRREEEGLFPMMVTYIGREMGPMAVMEHEHREAKVNIELFLHVFEKVKLAEHDEITAALTHLQKAVELLIQHFFKEENVLFPMAEQLLSHEEKERLQEMLQRL